MNFELVFTRGAAESLHELETNPAHAARYKAVRKTLGYMQTNLKHPSLNTHEFTSLTKAYGQKIFESYAQNRTPGAYRIFWHYGPTQGKITIISIVPHP